MLPVRRAIWQITPQSCPDICRQELGGADPGLDHLDQFEPEAQWQCSLGVAQLAFHLSLLAASVGVQATPDDWLILTQVCLWCTP